METLGVKEKEYIFVREVSTNTANYINQKSGIIESISNKISDDFQVVLSLKDKSRMPFFPSNWLILEEPNKDIHSLLYYSRLVISSGDSMAREGAQLGVPSFYCGIRNMHSNKILIDEGILFHVNAKELKRILGKSFKKPVDNFFFLQKLQNKMRKKFHIEWEDVITVVSKSRGKQQYNKLIQRLRNGSKCIWNWLRRVCNNWLPIRIRTHSSGR